VDSPISSIRLKLLSILREQIFRPWIAENAPGTELKGRGGISAVIDSLHDRHRATELLLCSKRGGNQPSEAAVTPTTRFGRITNS
jgi:hypothetical protein